MASILKECTYYRKLRAVGEERCRLLQHPYSPNLAPSDFNLFSLKDHLGSARFADQVENDLRKWLRHQSKDFYAAGFKVWVKQWDKCINVGGDC